MGGHSVSRVYSILLALILVMAVIFDLRQSNFSFKESVITTRVVNTMTMLLLLLYTPYRYTYTKTSDCPLISEDNLLLCSSDGDACCSMATPVRLLIVSSTSGSERADAVSVTYANVRMKEARAAVAANIKTDWI